MLSIPDASAPDDNSHNDNDNDPASLTGPPALSRLQTPSHRQLPPGADLTSEYPTADDSAWVYMTIQLYSIEKEFYLVDFKCAGYERILRRLVRVDLEGKGGGGIRREDERAERGRAYDSDSVSDSDSDGDSDSDSDVGGPGEKGEKARAFKRSKGRKHEERLEGHGRATWEKKVSSPFPFLDVASRLIIQLAEAE